MADDDMKENSLQVQIKELWNRAVEVVRAGGDEVVKTTKLGKIAIDTTLLKQKRNKLLQTLGAKTVMLISEQKLSSPELIAIYEEIRALESAIATHDARVEEVLKSGREPGSTS